VASQLHVVIREELAARRWSSTQLAERLGVRLGVVSRWLNEDKSKRVVPLPQMCVQIAEALDLNVIEVFRLAGYLPMPSDDLEALRHPHNNEIQASQRMLRRILEGIPEPAWGLAYPVAQAYLDGLQLILNRIDGHHYRD